MGAPRSRGQARSPGTTALFLAGLLALGACHLAPAKVWNLEQLHESDGKPRRRGNLKGDLGFLMSGVLRKTNFGGPEFRAREASEKRIKDPLGSCFENVLELGRCRRDEKVAALQAAAFGWLGVDCTYVLSRERCVLELGSLSQDLGLPGAAPPPEGEPVDAAAVQAALDDLITVLRGVVAAPGLAGNALVEACARVQALVLEREGALRVLRACNALFDDGEGGPEVAPLRALRLELARRVTALSLRAALADPSGRVRAAALEACLTAFPGERAGLLRWAATEAMDDVPDAERVSLRALELLAERGLPPAPEGMEAGAFRLGWERILEQYLRLALDGPHTLAACRALARITGEPSSQRPEHWLARARQRAAVPAEAPAP